MKATERLASAIVEDGSGGWILVGHPAAAPGWYRIRAITAAQGWVEIACGRGTPYVVPRTERLWWSPVQPPAEWWKPW